MGSAGVTNSPPEPRRVCHRCGGSVEVIQISMRRVAGGQVAAKIGACVRCAQWFNEAGLSELACMAESEPSA